MDLTITAVFYGLMGLAVAMAVILNSAGSRQERWFQTIAAILFWPIFIPLLLRPSDSQRATDSTTTGQSASAAVDLTQLIAQAEQNLAAALSRLAPNATGISAVDQSCLRELQSAWQLQSERIRELDTLIAQSDSTASIGLREIRDRLHHELTGTLNSAHNLVTTIHIARFNNPSTARAAELLAHLTATIENPHSADSKANG